MATVLAGAPDTVQVFDGRTWWTVTLPGAASGLAGAGYTFVTAVSGSSATAGVYQIKAGANTAQRVATAPGPDPAP
ncbi:hypothetical protein Kisp01_38130 [Kineosporia sp. NBRC 101677]|nr:hypothetical protein Kisp01_38130 [Kineosporia sp. NBRC 101677]